MLIIVASSTLDWISSNASSQFFIYVPTSTNALREEKGKRKGLIIFAVFLVCPLGGNNLARVRRLIYKESVEIINGVGAGPSPTHMNFSKHRAGPSETSAQGVLWTIIIIIIIIIIVG